MNYEFKLNEFQPLLNKFVKSKIYCSFNADDIVQETNKILINKEAYYDDCKPFSNWAITIAKFQIKKFLSSRRRSSSNTVSYDEFFNELLSCGSEVSPFEVLASKEKEEIFLGLISSAKLKMSKNESKVISLTISNFNNKQISKILKLTDSNVSVSKYRGIKKIKEVLS